jgi:hypothetical protein
MCAGFKSLQSSAFSHRISDAKKYKEHLQYSNTPPLNTKKKKANIHKCSPPENTEMIFPCQKI